MGRRSPAVSRPARPRAVRLARRRRLLRQHVDAPDPAPSATLIIGRDEWSDDYAVLHYDSRGISRVYQMSLVERSWKIWREAPGFSQRFSGTLSHDGSSVRAMGEKSADGSVWEHDFDLIYRRV